MASAKPVSGIGWLRRSQDCSAPRVPARCSSGHVGPGLDRTGAGPGDLDGRRAHRGALRTCAGVGRHSHRRRLHPAVLRCQWVPRARQRADAGPASGISGDPDGPDRRRRRDDPLPAVHTRGGVARPACRSRDRRAGGSGGRRRAPAAVVDELAGSSYDVVGLADTSVYANYELDPYAAKVMLGETLDGLLDLGVVRGSLATLARARSRSRRTPQQAWERTSANRSTCTSATARSRTSRWSPSTTVPRLRRRPAAVGVAEVT